MGIAASQSTGSHYKNDALWRPNKVRELRPRTARAVEVLLTQVRDDLNGELGTRDRARSTLWACRPFPPSPSTYARGQPQPLLGPTVQHRLAGSVFRLGPGDEQRLTGDGGYSHGKV